MHSKGFLLSLLLFLVVDSIKESNGSPSYQIVVTDKWGSFDAGQAHCKSLGMTLLRISNKEDNAFVFAHTKARDGGRFWIDGTRSGGGWVNSDGKKLHYYNWHQGEPNNYGGNENCIEMGFFGDDTWNDIACGNRLRIVCQNDDLDPSGLRGYQIVVTDKTDTFDAGREHCSSLGMTLLRISNNAENALVFSRTRARGVGRFWIDGARSTGDSWVNSDRKKLHYFKWHQGEPNNYGGNENCIEIGYFGDDTWNDIACGNRLRIVCQNDDLDSNAGTATNYANFELVPQKSRMNYGKAVDVCHDLHMELVKVDSRWMNRYVYRFAKRHNLGSYWINVNDIANEGHWVTSDREKATYTHWAPGEPNGGRSENCVHGLFYRKALWNDISCDSTNAVICSRLITKRGK